VIYSLLKPLLFRLDAERAHELVTGLLRVAADTPGAVALLRSLYGSDDRLLAVECAGLHFPNPIGLAAGFDKRGVLIGPMALLGFGAIEVGTVTPRPQPGNQRPRLFRLPEDGALINRLGFNSPGMAAVARNLRNRRGWRMEDGGWTIDPPSSILHPPSSDRSSVVVGVNIGKNRETPLERAVEDYLAAFVALAPLADYVVVNISSPNTPGLRRLHERAALDALLGELAALNRRLPRPRPLFLKVSPDETPAQLDEVVRAGLDAGIAGFVATNTTLARAGLRSHPRPAGDRADLRGDRGPAAGDWRGRGRQRGGRLRPHPRRREPRTALHRPGLRRAGAGLGDQARRGAAAAARRVSRRGRGGRC
jgi:dihydroorotate dehydrogenase